jgi:hypothetical protein
MIAMKAAPAERALGLALKVSSVDGPIGTRKALGNRLGLWINGRGEEIALLHHGLGSREVRNPSISESGEASYKSWCGGYEAAGCCVHLCLICWHVDSRSDSTGKGLYCSMLFIPIGPH